MRRLAESCVVGLCALALTAQAQHVRDPKASYVDVAARRAELEKNRDGRIAEAISSLAECAKLPVVAAPAERMIIPPHYISGSHGPVNPDEAKATRVYSAYERRVTAGMNRWLATGSRDEAQCAQQQIDVWAQGGALLDYDPKESRQAWFQVEWTLSATATSESVLMNETSLDAAMVKRDIAWMNRAAHRTMEFDKAGTEVNNHHYWRGLAATATGVISSDDELFRWGVGVFRQAVDAIDARGAFPLEMARHERAIHYQSFALQPLLPIAQFAERQGVDLYGYRSKAGRGIGDAVNFLGAAVANPEIVKVYASEPQLIDSDASDFFSFAEFYLHHCDPASMPPAILKGLERPTFATRVGGSTTVIDGYVPPAK
jgi:hypothetical protein